MALTHEKVSAVSYHGYHDHDYPLNESRVFRYFTVNCKFVADNRNLRERSGK